MGKEKGHGSHEPEPGRFRYVLQEALLQRCRKNPSYSLRAFARSLEVESSALSKILKGKRQATPATMVKIVDKLGLSTEEMAHLQGWKAVEYRELSLDEFAVISDWYHFAILDLTLVKGFQATPREIARTLGITPAEASVAWDRLVRLGMLAKNEKGKWRPSQSFTTTGNPVSASAYRHYQKQVLQKAIDALEEFPIEDRDQSAVSIAIKKSRLKEAKEKIREFRRELSGFLEADPEPDEVYNLVVSFYPVSRQTKSKKKGNT